MNLKKRMLLPCFFLGLGLHVNAQQATVASGGDASGSSGSSSYTVGQILYTTQSEASASSAMGVQQPIEVSELSTDPFIPMDFGIKVYPNPVMSYVNLEVDQEVSNKLSFELYDLNGRILDIKNVQETITKIDMAILPTAVYLLIIKKDGKQVKNFKLIKKD